MNFTPASIDHLERNIPESLRHARQFIPWKLVSRHGKNPAKVPLSPEGLAADSNDRRIWQRFDDVLTTLAKGGAFGIGLALPQVPIPGYDTVHGLVALDADAKNDPAVRPGIVPQHLLSYARRLDTYTEFSPSQRGLRSLAFGRLETAKQNVTILATKTSEICLYRAGWVTLTGLHLLDSPRNIEERQGTINEMVAECSCPSKEAEYLTAQSPAIHSEVTPGPPVTPFDSFVLDWNCMASPENVGRLIRGLNRTSDQVETMQRTWDMKRQEFAKYNAGPDRSMHTLVIVQESMFLAPYFGWTMQDVVDLAVTFCKANSLTANALKPKRLQSQIEHAWQYIQDHTTQLSRYSVLFRPQHPPYRCYVRKHKYQFNKNNIGRSFQLIQIATAYLHADDRPPVTLAHLLLQIQLHRYCYHGSQGSQGGEMPFSTRLQPEPNGCTIKQ